MLGAPGSLTAYSKALRSGLPPPNDTPPTVGPSSYNVKPATCRPCVEETVAPFNNTEERKLLVVPKGLPSPADYYPWKRPRYEVGSPIMRGWNRFPRTLYGTDSPGPMYRIRDPWQKLVEECQEMESKRWRTNYDKYQSNGVPPIFRPLEIRCFVQGWDGRMYPWKNECRKPRIPGPIYSTYGITTSKSKKAGTVNFHYLSSRKPLFEITQGSGPADFCISRDMGCHGGIFLSQTDDPRRSTPRLFELIMDRQIKTVYPSPFSHYVRRLYDCGLEGVIVRSPFKSTFPRFGHANKDTSPAPNAYYSMAMRLEDLIPMLYPGSRTRPPVSPGFNVSSDRFTDARLIEESSNWPSPCSYTLPSFTDLLECNCKRHKPAIHNPKLGFLTSADARPGMNPAKGVKKCCGIIGPGSCDHVKERTWRNLRPRNVVKTYPFHGPVKKYEGSPGPIYDTRMAAKAVKAKKDWWDPRHVAFTAFNNSGPAREGSFGIVDMNIPGPGLYYAEKPLKRCMKLNIKTTGARTRSVETPGPGPWHKLHEKAGSSMWRATHLGTFNVALKGLEIQRPSAGGFRPHGPLDQWADMAAKTFRSDDYAACKCPSIPGLTSPRTRSRKQTLAERQSLVSTPA